VWRTLDIANKTVNLEKPRPIAEILCHPQNYGVRVIMNRTTTNSDLGVLEFLNNLEESMLLSAEEIERSVAALPGGATDSDFLGRALVNAGLLTWYQLEAVRGQRAPTIQLTQAAPDRDRYSRGSLCRAG
jgi:hypothetical protein